MLMANWFILRNELNHRQALIVIDYIDFKLPISVISLEPNPICIAHTFSALVLNVHRKR